MTSVRFRSWTRSGTNSERTFVNAAATQAKPTRRLLIAWYCVLLLWCVFSTGCCRVLGLAYRTTIAEPRAYWRNCDKHESLEIYSQWADQAWREQSEACTTAILQPDYAAGFHEGFVDYVYAGGSGEPPPVPPRIFWNASLRTADGKLRANQWFEGYRHGARVAREGGYREMATISTSVIDHQCCGALPPGQIQMTNAGGTTAPQPTDNVEELPPASANSGNGETTESPFANDPEGQPADLTLPFDDPTPVNPWTSSRNPEAFAPLPKASRPTSDADNSDSTSAAATDPKSATAMPESRPADSKSKAMLPVAAPKVDQSPTDSKSPPEINKSDTNSDDAFSEPADQSATPLRTTSEQERKAVNKEPAVLGKQKTDIAASDETASPFLTPRVRAASAVLFGR